MHWIIKPAVTAIRTNPTPQQKNSSLFSEAPVVAGKTLRRGQSIVLDEAGMKLHENHLKRLLDAHAIVVTRVDSDGKEFPVQVEEPKPTSIAADLKKEAEVDKLLETVIPADHAEEPKLEEKVEEPAPVAVSDEAKVSDSATVEMKSSKKSKRG